MSKTASIYTRVEPALKDKVEHILQELGIPMTNAITLYLHQIVLNKGIPFRLMIPQKLPLNYSALPRQQFDMEIEKGFSSLQAGNTLTAREVRENIQRQYDI